VSRGSPTMADCPVLTADPVIWKIAVGRLNCTIRPGLADTLLCPSTVMSTGRWRLKVAMFWPTGMSVHTWSSGMRWNGVPVTAKSPKRTGSAGRALGGGHGAWRSPMGVTWPGCVGAP